MNLRRHRPRRINLRLTSREQINPISFSRGKTSLYRPSQERTPKYDQSAEQIKSVVVSTGLAVITTCLYPCVFLFSQNAGEANAIDMLPFS